ncbi:hypothetical protein HW130_13690 [Streptomyces sp. PKU-EA00015]|uniref:hypothetical protein n=1 Tax=Streptomyces sp. PKU-EA00015 TaxID=2748326 RepID=UPI0015A1132A|nr:hypothetical protein [Streptomyces sp. PKU-EA00015]NWF27312.1 hypothetical protein [Streptomyces sp. PKU-EA00015]
MSVEPSEYVKRLPIGERIPFPAEGIRFPEDVWHESNRRIAQAMANGDGTAHV